MENLEKLLKFLIESPLDFVIVGGFAAVLHGCDQTTRDIDICIAMSADKINELKETLSPLNPKIRTFKNKISFLDFATDKNPITELHLETDLGILDIISHVKAVGDFYAVLKNSQEIEMYDKVCHVIAIDDLIACKKALGGHKDLAVAEELESLKSLNS